MTEDILIQMHTRAAQAIADQVFLELAHRDHEVDAESVMRDVDVAVEAILDGAREFMEQHGLPLHAPIAAGIVDAFFARWHQLCQTQGCTS